MIEFKADCGHTVRARDEDAGRAVRCSYCGRAADVPDQKTGDGLDFLFTDLQAQSAPTAASRVPVPRRKGLFSRKARRGGEFNPFAVVVKLCYIAGILIVVIVVARKWVLPLFEKDGLANRLTKSVKETTVQNKPQRGGGVVAANDRGADKPGLKGREKMIGLYVSSTPPGATAYAVEATRAPAKGPINLVDGVQQIQTPGSFTNLHDGEYVVQVELRWSDPAIKKYDDFTGFRRSIEHASAEERRRRMVEYFLPDGASDVLVDRRDDLYLVRQYRGVHLRQPFSPGVRALFLPRGTTPDKPPFSVQKLVDHYLPKEEAYVLDEKDVREELGYHGVMPDDIDYVMIALRRIGVFPYLNAGTAQLFKIRMENGTLFKESLSELLP